MKLTKRNSGSAYGARVDGYDFHIYRSTSRYATGWTILLREVDTVGGVETAVGQPILGTFTEQTLVEIRAILDEFATTAEHSENGVERYRLARGRYVKHEIDRVTSTIFGRSA